MEVTVMSDANLRLKHIEHQTWVFTKRTLIGIATVLVILLALFVAFSAAP